jgi:CHAT domain
MFTQTSELPPLDISPVHAQITIYANNGEYIAYVITEMGAFPLAIHLKPHDIKNLNNLMQKAIQDVASNFGKGDAYELALGKLARMGNYAFQRLFPAASSQETIRKALGTGSFIQIVSKDLFVPWELLYDGPLDENADIRYYWGMSHIITRTIIQDIRRGAYVSPVIEAKRPKIGLVTSDRLSYVEKQEVPMFKKLHQNRRISLTPLRTLSVTQRDSELEEIRHFPEQELQIIHFACHAYEQDPLESSYIYITKDFPITMIDFVVSKYELKYNPFVVLNACLTSIINPLYTSSWAEKFWEHGARGVLATDFQVPDWFAASFSELLYRYLLSDMPIGETLLTTRRQFWSEQHNPLGLAYALYSSPSIKIVRTKKR